MLANLKRMGTNPQAVEQPLDLNVSENKIKTLYSLPKLYQTATIEDKRYLVETIIEPQKSTLQLR